MMTIRTSSNAVETTSLKQGISLGPVVDLHQVVKTYRGTAGTFTALKGVDLQVEAGAFVSIIGKSGSGKSTLINVITGINRPSSGEVIVDGTHVHALNEEQIAV